ncbi:unnamed protein product [Blepharisma stoltei]|uniref:Uncharacterized protein n=1 Tax=Blepharisma stoltei TaxID=1481888 RepID=A0AAU9KCA5_9CILI|nr:unnamed protein product [Blepharisma stoltei]
MLCSQELLDNWIFFVSDVNRANSLCRSIKDWKLWRGNLAILLCSVGLCTIKLYDEASSSFFLLRLSFPFFSEAGLDFCIFFKRERRFCIHDFIDQEFRKVLCKSFFIYRLVKLNQ